MREWNAETCTPPLARLSEPRKIWLAALETQSCETGLEERLRNAIVKQNLSERTRVVTLRRNSSNGRLKCANGLHMVAALRSPWLWNQLPVSLFLRQTADDRQQDAFAIEGTHEDDDQNDKKGQTYQFP